MKPASQALSDVFKDCRSAVISIVVVSGVVNVLYLTGSFFMLVVYDRVIPSKSIPSLVGLVLLALMLYAFRRLGDHASPHADPDRGDPRRVSQPACLQSRCAGPRTARRPEPATCRCGISIKFAASCRAQRQPRFATFPGCRSTLRSAFCFTRSSASLRWVGRCFSF